MANVFIPTAFVTPVTALEVLLTQDPAQQRRVLRPHPTLMKVAHERADDMAVRRYFGHVNPDGHAANWLVREKGYSLPAHYGQSLASNNIESIAGGYPNVQAVWESWLGSPKHRAHVLGENSFFRDQDEYGIGFVHIVDSPYQFYWVLIIARRGN